MRSFESDCDSLASDMISLCSISKPEERTVSAPSRASSFRKTIVNRTPSKLTRQASGDSIFGGHLGEEKQDVDEEGSVAALQSLNLDNGPTSKLSDFGGPPLSVTNARLCPTSSKGERL